MFSSVTSEEVKSNSVPEETHEDAHETHVAIHAPSIQLAKMGDFDRSLVSLKTGLKYAGTMLGGIFIVLQVIDIIVLIPDVVMWTVSLGSSAIIGGVGTRRKWYKTHAKEAEAQENADNLARERAEAKAEKVRLEKQITALTHQLVKTSATADVIVKHVTEMHEESSQIHHSHNSHNSHNSHANTAESPAPHTAPVMHIHLAGDVTPQHAHLIKQLSMTQLPSDAITHQPPLTHMASAPLTDSSPRKHHQSHHSSHGHHSHHRHDSVHSSNHGSGKGIQEQHDSGHGSHHGSGKGRHGSGRRHSARRVNRDTEMSVSQRHSLNETTYFSAGKDSPTARNSSGGDPASAHLISPLNRLRKADSNANRTSSDSKVILSQDTSDAVVLNDAPQQQRFQSAPANTTPPQIAHKPLTIETNAKLPALSSNGESLFVRRNSRSTSRNKDSQIDNAPNIFGTNSTEVYKYNTETNEIDPRNDYSPSSMSLNG